MAAAKIRIVVAAHKPYWMPQDPLYLPLHVGREGKEGFGIAGDNTGTHISYENSRFCELTGLYWAWKNLDSDFIGLCHYRRYFSLSHSPAVNPEQKRRRILTLSQAQRLLAREPVVVPSPRRYFIESNRSHYAHAHYEKDLAAIGEIISQRHPAYSGAFDTVMRRTWAHMFNMLLMDSAHLDAYCAWLFDILFQACGRIDTTRYDGQQARVFGYLSELLLDVWLLAGGIRYKEIPYLYLEKQDWIQKGGHFLARKLRGGPPAPV